MSRLALTLFLLSVLGGCAEAPPTRTPDWVEGSWRVALEVPGGELPFVMEVAQSEAGLTATLLNGNERVPASDVGLLGNRLVVNFKVYNSRIDGTLETDGMVGSLSIVRQGGREHVIPFHAQKGITERFAPGGEPPAVTVTGRWEVVFRDDTGGRTEAVGEFVQDGEKLRGTFLTPTGDYRYLQGDVHGRNIRLSCFDGYHAFLFHAAMDDTGVLRGDFWSGRDSHETWTAVRNEHATLPDPNALTYLKPGFDRLNFAFPDTSGKLVSLSDPRFDGKVVLVSVAGTWCPNCHDEAAFLHDLYTRYHKRGLEIVMLMYEHVGDFESAARQVREFRRSYRLAFDILIAGTSNKEEASKSLPMLNHVLAYPTTIFVDRGRHVRKIHTGFAGPGTGQHYADLKAEYRQYVELLLAEPNPSIAESH